MNERDVSPQRSLIISHSELGSVKSEKDSEGTQDPSSQVTSPTGSPPPPGEKSRVTAEVVPEDRGDLCPLDCVPGKGRMSPSVCGALPSPAVAHVSSSSPEIWLVTLRWKLGPRGSECAWVTQAGAVSSSGQGYHCPKFLRAGSLPPVLLGPLSLETGRLARGHRKMPQSQDWITVSAYVQTFSPLQKKKKKTTIAWVEPTQCNVPRVLYWAALGRRITQTLCSALTHTPLQGAAHGGPWPQEDRLEQTSFPRGQPCCTSASHP